MRKTETREYTLAKIAELKAKLDMLYVRRDKLTEQWNKLKAQYFPGEQSDRDVYDNLPEKVRGQVFGCYSSLDTTKESIAKWERELSRKQAHLHNLDEAEKAANAVPECPALEQFLAKWRQSYEAWLRMAVAEYKDKRASEDEDDLNRQYTLDVVKMVQADDDGKLDTELTKFLDSEVTARRNDLYRRCRDRVGNIRDVGELFIGDNGSINGVVRGDKGNAFVQTIWAGGYNIQRLHYRVLVTPCV